MSTNEEKIEEFVSITGASAENAAFFLESSGWEMQTAMQTFLDQEDAQPAEPAPAPASDAAGAKLTVQAGEASQSEGEQRWYTGGAAGSGQEVIAPPKGNKPVDDVFNAAKEMGARNATSEDVNPSVGAFSGGARTLAGGVVKAKEPPKQHVIKFYANEVFTVDDGPPRNIHDKANMEFMGYIMKGQVPPELENTETDVQLVNLQEDYVEAARPRPTFQGTGNRLGGASTSAAAAAPAVAPSSALEWEGPNDALPITSLQLRLPDGSRMVAKFNHSQPVSDIRKFVASARPDFTSAFSMLSGFPAIAIPDESLSLEAAGLLNATIILR